METDKRPFYIWMAVLLANITAAAIIVLSSHSFSLSSLSSGLLPLGVFLFMSAVPVLIAGSKSSLKNIFGYGIPLLLLSPLPYFIWHYYNCTGKFCNLLDALAIWVLGLSAAIFVFFYVVGVYFRKWNVNFVLCLISVELFLLIYSILHFGNIIQ